MATEGTRDRSLVGKVALITGSGRGIGRGIALELGQRGASVVVNYANTSAGADEVVKEIEKAGSKAIAVKADVTKVSDIARLFQEGIDAFGHLDICVSNSGTGKSDSFHYVNHNSPPIQSHKFLHYPNNRQNPN